MAALMGKVLKRSTSLLHNGMGCSLGIFSKITIP